jgi:membrane protein involved in colicin uptake
MEVFGSASAQFQNRLEAYQLHPPMAISAKELALAIAIINNADKIVKALSDSYDLAMRVYRDYQAAKAAAEKAAAEAKAKAEAEAKAKAQAEAEARSQIDATNREIDRRCEGADFRMGGAENHTDAFDHNRDVIGRTC